MKATGGRRPATRNGFTTLEIIFVVAVLSLIVVAIAPFFRATVAGWELKDRQLEILQNGRVGMDEMMRTVKSAVKFTAADTTYIGFTDAASIDVEFRLNSGALEKKETGTQWDTLAGPLDSLIFTYYDRNGDTTSDTAGIHSVKITMVVSDSEGKVSPVTFNSQITPRKGYYLLAINEINYNPPGSGGDERKREWVELYNYGTTAIDLTGWQVSDSNSTDDLYSGNGTMTIPAGGYAVITATPTDVYDYYTVDPGAVRLRVGDNRIGGNGLGDNTDTITILDSYGSTIDVVTYDNSWGGNGNGDTIERRDAKSGPSDPSNWEASSTWVTYTAGSANTVSP